MRTKLYEDFASAVSKVRTADTEVQGRTPEKGDGKLSGFLTGLLDRPNGKLFDIVDNVGIPPKGILPPKTFLMVEATYRLEAEMDNAPHKPFNKYAMNLCKQFLQNPEETLSLATLKQWAEEYFAKTYMGFKKKSDRTHAGFMNQSYEAAGKLFLIDGVVAWTLNLCGGNPTAFEVLSYLAFGSSYPDGYSTHQVMQHVEALLQAPGIRRGPSISRSGWKRSSTEVEYQRHLLLLPEGFIDNENMGPVWAKAKAKA